MELKRAKQIAIILSSKLQPYCKAIHIAGSIRREKKEVGDIEIVCAPKDQISTDLFGNVIATNRCPNFCSAAFNLGRVIKGNPTGKYIQIELSEGINLDLFMPDDEDYFRQLAIRTGSAEYSNKVIAAAWLKNGWCGSDKGLRKIKDCVRRENSWVCVVPNAERPPAWNSEQEFYDWIKVRWIPPHLRFIINPFNKIKR